MAKRVIFAIIWCIVLYFGACMVVGAIAGGLASANLQPGQDPATIGAQAGANVVGQYRAVIGVAAVCVVILGTYLQFLPGTRGKARVDA